MDSAVYGSFQINIEVVVIWVNSRSEHLRVQFRQGELLYEKLSQWSS